MAGLTDGLKALTEVFVWMWTIPPFRIIIIAGTIFILIEMYRNHRRRIGK